MGESQAQQQVGLLYKCLLSICIDIHLGGELYVKGKLKG